MCVEGRAPINWLIEQYELLDQHFHELGRAIYNDAPNLFCDTAAKLMARHHRVMHDAIREQVKVLKRYRDSEEDPMPNYVLGLAEAMVQQGIIRPEQVILPDGSHPKGRPPFPSNPNLN